MSEEHRKKNFKPTNPSKKQPDEQRRGQSKSNSRGKTR